MASNKEEESYLELYDLARKEKVAKASLAEIKFVPRTGERIFIPLKGPRDWDSYTVVAVEYFLGYDPLNRRTIPIGFQRYRTDCALRRSIEVEILLLVLDGSDTQTFFKRTTMDLAFTL